MRALATYISESELNADISSHVNGGERLKAVKQIPVKPMDPLNDGIVIRRMDYNNQSALINDKADTLEQFDFLRITKEKQIDRPEPTITIGGAAFASPRNIYGIGAPSKSGKTAIASVFVAGAISRTGEVDGIQGINVRPNVNGYAVIHFDTEQSEDDQQSNVTATMDRAGFDSTPDYYRAYNITALNIDQYKGHTLNICRLCKERFGGVHLIIIDGGADYIMSVNDEEASTSILQYFRHLSIEFNCPVVLLVHQNPGSDKERGHFGSILQRKCYGLISISREGDVSTLTGKLLRKAAHEDVPDIHFKFSKEKGYHVAVDAISKEEIKESKKRNKDIKEREWHNEVANQVFSSINGLLYTEATKAIMKATNFKDRKAKEMIKDMRGWEQIELRDDKKFYLKK